MLACGPYLCSANVECNHGSFLPYVVIAMSYHIVMEVACTMSR